MPGMGKVLIAVCIFLFAFTTVLNYYYQGETALAYLLGNKKKCVRTTAITCLRIIMPVVFYLFSIASSNATWSIGEIGVGLMVWTNVVVLLVMKAVSEAALDPENYKYSITELPELIEAMKNHYYTRFGVSLDEAEIMAVYGSQEGIAHIGLPLINPGDKVLVPNPGYQIFGIGPFLCEAELVPYPLYESNHFLPDLEAIPDEISEAAKFMRLFREEKGGTAFMVVESDETIPTELVREMESIENVEDIMLIQL